MIADIRVDTGYRDSLSRYTDAHLGEVESLEVPWENSASQIAKLDQFPAVEFTLLVKDIQAAVQAADRLGRAAKLEMVRVQEGKVALLDRKAPKWREFVQKNGAIVSRAVLLQLLTQAMKRGNRTPLTLVMEDILAGSMHVRDADVFLRLHKIRGL